jgi:hypothetical protein
MCHVPCVCALQKKARADLSARVYVGNLTAGVTGDAVAAVFASAGEVVNVIVKSTYGVFVAYAVSHAIYCRLLCSRAIGCVFFIACTATVEGCV